MKKFILGILLSVFCASIIASPTFTPEEFIITNNGSVDIYYSLSAVNTAYNNTLCIKVNDMTVKQEVNGLIASGVSETLSLLALDDYVDYCDNTWVVYTFSLGLTEDGAKYNQNWIYLNQQFNFEPNTNGTKPFAWSYSYHSPNNDVFIIYNTPEDSIIFYIDSDAESFVY